MTRSPTVALVLGLVLVFAVALALDIGGEGAALWYTRPGAAAIAGAFIGGASAAVASYLADQRRFRREDAAVRRQVYSEFLASWNLYEESRAERLTTSQPLQRLIEADEAYLALLRSFNALSLIAPEEVRAAASGMIHREEGAPGRFWEAARKDLDIPD